MDIKSRKRAITKVSMFVVGIVSAIFLLLSFLFFIGILTKEPIFISLFVLSTLFFLLFLFSTIKLKRDLKKLEQIGFNSVQEVQTASEIGMLKKDSFTKDLNIGKKNYVNMGMNKMGKCKQCGKFGLGLRLNSEGLCPQCQIANLQNKVNELSCPEYQDLAYIREQIEKSNKKLSLLISEITGKQASLAALDNEIESKQKEVINLNNIVEMQEFGVYEPNFEFLKAEEYKNRLSKIREQQKAMIKDKIAVSGYTNWTVNNSLAQGKKMVSDTQKLLLRAFNGECDELVAKVKYNNLDATIKRINASCDAISKLGKVMNISIKPSYKALKIEEVKLAYEYAQAKQKEKEDMKAYREQLREEAKLQKEIEEQRKKILKEQTHYANAIAKLRMQLSEHPDDADLKAKLDELTEQYDETEKAMKNIDYREANKRAGYVYIISNIGSFGENVFKIGMTRRLDPQDRIDELGDASVPFNFDVHAMIFTDDAPKLEAALHNAFEDRKLNLVNHRREFFNVTLDEIKKVVKENYDKTVEFVDVPDAEQYRMSKNIKQSIK